MRLVCLGVIKKLLSLWMSKGPLSVRMRAKTVQDLSELLMNLNQYVSCDFARKV